jgi:AraC-like DNA-binding protein
MRTVDWAGEWLESTALPIRVLWSGSSVWLPGNYWERRGSTHLGIELVTHGRVTLQTEGKEWTVHKGEMFTLRRGGNCRYATGPCPVLHKRFVALDGSVLDAVQAAGLLGTSPVIRPDDPVRIGRLFKKINGLLRDKPPSFHLSASMVAYELLLEVQRSVRHAWPPAVERAVRFITHNLGRPLSAAELSRRAGVSASHLCLLFRQTLGCAPLQYCIDRKMAVARHLLTYSDTSIKEIAQIVGYSDQLHFSKSFRRHTGCAPRDFRAGKRPGN